MPIAPGLTPTVAPTGFAPEVNLPVPVDAFGGAVGRALEGLGSAVEQGSDRIWQRAMEMQGIRNETEAKQGDAQFAIQSAKLRAEFLNKEGLNASSEALSQHYQDLENLRTQIRGSLSNPAAQRMYDGSSLGFMSRELFSAAAHSSQQLKVAAVQAADARIQNAKVNSGNNPDDPISQQRNENIIRSENRAKGKYLGSEQDTIDASINKDLSEKNSHHITAVSKTNAIKAQALLDEARKSGSVNDRDAEMLQNTVTAEYRRQGSKFYADKVLGDRREGEDMDKNENDYINEAIGLAKDQIAKDPALEDWIRSRVSTEYRRQIGVERDSQLQAYQIVQGAMNTANSEGVLPTNPEQLYAVDPRVEGAWSKLRETQKKDFLRALGVNALGHRVVPTEENIRRYGVLKGMAETDPDKFLTIDVASENMPFAWRKELAGLQAAKTKDPSTDPRVLNALRVLGRDPDFAGISKKQTPEDYANFVGALQGAIAARQADTKAALKDDDIQKIGARVLRDIAVTKGWLFSKEDITPQLATGKEGWDIGTTKFYNIPVPDKDIARIKKEWTDATGAPPTAQMIHNYYFREQYNRLFGGSAKKLPLTAAPQGPISE